MWKTSETESEPHSSPLAAEQGKTFLGPSVVIKGELSAEEGLVVQGQVEGSLKLTGGDVLVGEHGRVQGDIVAATIEIEGEVKGNLVGEESILIHPTGKVKGDLQAPKVALEEGCTVRGRVETSTKKTGTTKREPMDVVVEVTA